MPGIVMTITAKNIGRINVWPTYRIAREADTEESKFVGQLTVWQTNEEALANTTHEEGGGGGGDWVPANAVIHIDLVGGDPQGRAWVAGTGVVAVDTLLGTDPNTESAYGLGAYVPEHLVAGEGYGRGDGEQPLMSPIGVLRDALVAGSTFTIKLKTSRTTGSLLTFYLLAVDGLAALELKLNTTSAAVHFSTWDAGGISRVTLSVLNISAAGVANNVAATFIPTRADISANGSVATSDVLTTDNFPVSGPSAIVCGVIEHGGNGVFIQSITLYDPLPSTAGLSELSEVT
jgi:hypothetical protein